MHKIDAFSGKMHVMIILNERIVSSIMKVEGWE